MDWYIKFTQVPTGTPTKTMVEIENGLIEEFINPKFEAQYIIEIKEIRKYPNESVWDFD